MNCFSLRAVKDNCPYLKSVLSWAVAVIHNRSWHGVGFSIAILLVAGCQTASPPSPKAPARTDDLIIVDGQRFHAGTRVVTWKEKGSYNAYEFTPTELAGTANHGARRLPSTDVEGGWIDREEPWDLSALQGYVDQFVLHYDSEGFSRRCFEVLQRRGLSAHFLLDLDGTIFQTLDLRERAYHATSSNSRSIGIEIANAGAFSDEEQNELSEWYQRDVKGNIAVRIPKQLGDPKFHTSKFIAHPNRAELIEGKINGRALRQYDFTPEQYAALIKLTATLHRVFPLIQLDMPRDSQGQPISKKLSDKALENFQGLLGHYHIQEIKIDPGPAFDWDKTIEGARQELETIE